jgi:hypothetical protein
MSTPTPIADIEIFRHAQNLVSSRSYARSQTPLKPLRPSQISLVPTNLRVGGQKRQRQRKPLLKQEEESEEDEESEESDEEDLEGLTTEELEARELCAWAKDLDGPNRPRSKSRSKSRLQPEPMECIGSAAQFRKELLAQSRSQAHSQDSESKKSQVLLATPAKTTTPDSKTAAQSSPNSTTTTPVTTTTTPTSKKKSSSTSKKRKRASTSPPSDLDSPVASASAPGQLGSNRRFGYDGNDGPILSASQPLPARKSLLPLIRYTPSIAGYAVHYGS